MATRFLATIFSAALVLGNQATAQVRFDAEVCGEPSDLRVQGQVDGDSLRLTERSVSRYFEIRYGTNPEGHAAIQLRYWTGGREYRWCHHELSFPDTFAIDAIEPLRRWRDYFPDYELAREVALEPCVSTPMRRRPDRFGVTEFRDQDGRLVVFTSPVPSCGDYVDNASVAFAVSGSDRYYLVLVILDQIFVLQTATRPN